MIGRRGRDGGRCRFAGRTTGGAAVLSLLLVCALLQGGCDRDDDWAKPAPAASATRPTTGSAPAAAPEHFVSSEGVIKPVASDRPASARPAATSVPPAPKPTGPLPPDASCVTAECHATYATAAHVHGPVSERACGSCHGPDTGEHRYPLLRGAIDTCTTCHPVGTGSETMVKHAPIKEGCNTCHDPHVSNTKFLLKADSVEQLCASCHNTPLKRYSHEPFTKGQCTLCHQPHEADNRMLLRGGQGSEHCLSCHKGVRDSFASATVVHEPARTECITCHSPHATDYQHVLKRPVDQTCLSCHPKVKDATEKAVVKHDAMTDDRSCVNCHSGHASSQRNLILAKMDAVCLNCHADSVKADDGRTVAAMEPVLRKSRFLHGPIRAGDCAGCHAVHGSDNPSLLSAAFPGTFYTRFDIDKYALCFNCHEKDLVQSPRTRSLTNFRDGNLNLHYLHVNREDKGRTCKSCHAMHGSDLPNHIAAEVAFEGSRWAMPVGYEKQPEGGTCTPGCHQAKSYSRQAPDAPTTRGVP